MKILFRKIHDTVYQRRFLFLFIALLIPYVIHPLIATEVMGLAALDLSFSLVLVIGVLAVSERKHLAITALAIVIVAQGLTWTSHAVSSHALILAGLLVTGIYLAYTAGVLLFHVVKSRSPTSNTIFAALCIYLLVGFLWAFIYSFLQDLDPNSFHFNPEYYPPVPHGKHLYSLLYNFIYFSFTTLTTLGFGDIMPTSHWSRMFASMEAVLGQLYLVVMVTYLIGLHLNERVHVPSSKPTPNRSKD